METTFRLEAINILKSAKKPLHVKEITKEKQQKREIEEYQEGYEDGYKQGSLKGRTQTLEKVKEILKGFKGLALGEVTYGILINKISKLEDDEVKE